MGKVIFLKWLMLFVLLVNSNVMQSQENQKLNTRQQSIVSISALTAAGNLEELKLQLNNSLDTGELTINEIKEVLVQLYAYCGFPRSLNAITTFMSVLEERKSKGITDEQGKEININNNAADKYEQGRKVLEVLTQTPQPKPAPGFGEFAPRIDVFLKEHLFADIFDSDVLTWQQRELATISALSAMSDVEPQLQAHLKMGMKTGLTESELAQVAELIEKYVSKTQANMLRKLLNKPIVPLTEPGIMVRISEIKIYPGYFNKYNAILKEEAELSVKTEPGVLAIFPMYQKEDSTQIRILEIYANKEAYQSHLQTPHFQHYKTTTLKMVKSLKLADMNAIDRETIPTIFRKL